MPIPLIGLDTRVRQFAESLRECFSKPQFKYFVTVLVGLLLCQEAHTLSGLLRQIMEGPTLSGLSRFFAEAPWEAEVVVVTWFKRFREQMQPKVAAEQERQRQQRPKRRGRPRTPVVTGYLMGDDSTIQKRKGQKMQVLGKHHSTTEGKRVRGHRPVSSFLTKGYNVPYK